MALTLNIVGTIPLKSEPKFICFKSLANLTIALPRTDANAMLNGISVILQPQYLLLFFQY